MVCGTNVPTLEHRIAAIAMVYGEVLKGTRPKGALEVYSNFNGGNFLLTVGACLLTVGLLCLQSLWVLIRRTFPL